MIDLQIELSHHRLKGHVREDGQVSHSQVEAGRTGATAGLDERDVAIDATERGLQLLECYRKAGMLKLALVQFKVNIVAPRLGLFRMECQNGPQLAFAFRPTAVHTQVR